MRYDAAGTPLFSGEDEAIAALENPDLSREDRLAAEVTLAAMRSGLDAEELSSYETISQGQADDLKIETPDGARFWLSRTGVADGEPFENTVTIERQDNPYGGWEVVAKYDGGDAEEPMGVEGDAEEEANEAAQRFAEGQIGRFVLEAEPGNEAMQSGADVAEALRAVAEYLEGAEPTAWNGEGPVRDRNGNTVGRWTFHDFNELGGVE